MAENVPIISGVVTLDTAPFLAALATLQTQVVATVAKLQASLGSLGVGTGGKLDAAALSAGKLSSSFKTASTDTAALSQNLTKVEADLRATENAFNSIYRAGSQLSSFGLRLTAMGGAIEGILGGAMAAAAGFDFYAHKAAAASSATDDLGHIVGNAQDQFAGMSKAIEGVTVSVGAFKPQDVANAFYQWVSATGVTIKSQQDLAAVAAQVNVILKASAIAGMDSTTAIKGVAGVLGQFGLDISQTGDAMAILLNITQKTNAELPDMISAFTMVGPSAKAAGMSLGDTAAIIGELSQVNIKGSAAGRDLQRILQSFINPSTRGAAVLQQLTDGAGYLGKSWHDVLFPGNQFIGLMDTINNGVVTQQGVLGILNSALSKMGTAQGQQALAMMETQNGYRGLLPLVEDYAKSTTIGADGIATSANEMEQFAAQLNNAALQGQLFNEQWDQVKQSIDVVAGQQINRLKFGLIDLGEAAKGAVIPFLTSVADIVEGIRNWASNNSDLFRQIIQIAGAIGGMSVAFGTVLLVLGQLTQAVATMKIAWTAVQVVFLALGEMLLPFVAIFSAIGVAVLALSRYAQDSGNIADLFTKVKQAIEDLVGVGSTALGEFVQLVNAIFHGDYKSALDYAEQITTTLGAGILNVFSSLKGLVGQVLTDLETWLDGTFNGLGTNMKVWGENVLGAFAGGMNAGIAKYIVPAINAVIDMLSRFLEGHSPPKEGDLKDISTWGANIMTAYVEGMKNADFSAVQDALSQVKDALTNDAGLQEGTKQYNDILNTVNGTVAAIIQGHKDLATVGQDTWNKLTATLGSGYVTALQNVISAQQQVTDIQNTQSQVKSDIATNQMAVQKIENTQVLPLQNKIDENNAKKEGLALDKAGYELTVAQDDAQKSADQDQITFWDEKKADAQVLSDHYQSEIDDVNKVRNGIQDQINTITDETTAIDDQIATMQRRYNLEHAQQQLSIDLLKDQLDLNKSIEDAKMAPLNAQAATLKDQLTSLKEKFSIQEAPLKLQVEELKATGNTAGASALQKELDMMTAQHNIAISALQNKYDIVNHQITLATQAFNSTQQPLTDQYTAANDAKKTEDAQQKLATEGLLSALNARKDDLAGQKLDLNIQLHSSDKQLHDLTALKDGVTITIKGYDEQIAKYNNDIRRIDDLERPLKEHITALSLQIQALDLTNQGLQTTIDGIRRIQETPFKLKIQDLQDQLNGPIQAALQAAQAILQDARNQLTVVNAGMRKGPATADIAPTDPNGALGQPTPPPYQDPNSSADTLKQPTTDGKGDNGKSLIVTFDPFGGLSNRVQATKNQLEQNLSGVGSNAGGFLSSLLGRFGVKGPGAPTAPGSFQTRRGGRLGGSMDSLDYQGAEATYAQQLAAFRQGGSTYNNFASQGSSLSPIVMPGLAALRFPGQIGALGGEAGGGISAILGKLADGLGYLGQTKARGQALDRLQAIVPETTDPEKIVALNRNMATLKATMGTIGESVYAVISKIDELSAKLRLPGLKDGEEALNSIRAVIDTIVVGPGKALLDIIGKIGSGGLAAFSKLGSGLIGAAEKARTAFVGVLILLNTLFDPFLSKIDDIISFIGFLGKEVGLSFVGLAQEMRAAFVGVLLRLNILFDPFINKVKENVSGIRFLGQEIGRALGDSLNIALGMIGKIGAALHDIPGIRGLGDLLGKLGSLKDFSIGKLGDLKDASLGKAGDLLGGGKGIAGDAAGGLGKILGDVGGGALAKVGETLKTILFPFSFIIDHGKQFEGVFGAIRTIFDAVFSVGTKVGEVLMHFVGILEKIPLLGQLLKAIPLVGEILTIIQIVEALRKAWTTNWMNIQLVVMLAWQKIQAPLAALKQIMGEQGGLLGHLDEALPKIAEILGAIIGAIAQLAQNIIAYVQANWPTWSKNIGKEFNNLFSGLRSWWDDYGTETLTTVGQFFANLVGGLLNFIINNALPWALNLLTGWYQLVTHLFQSLDNAVTSDGGVQGQGSFGKWFGTLMTNFMNWVGANYQSWATNLGGALIQMVEAIIQLLLVTAKLLLHLAEWFGKLMLGLIGYVGANYQIWGKQLFDHLTSMMTGLWDLLTKGNGGAGTGFIGQLWDWFTKLVAGLMTLIKNNWKDWAKTLLDMYVDLVTLWVNLLVKAALDAVVFTVWFAVLVKNFLGKVKDTLPDWIGQLKDHFVNWITGASDSLNKDSKPGDSIFTTFKNILGTVLGAVAKFVTTDLLPGLADIGKSMISGITSGITSGAGGLASALGGALHGNLTGVGSAPPPSTSGDAGVYKKPVIDHWDNGKPVYKEGAGGGVSQSADVLINASNAITSGYANLCETFAETVIANATGQPYKAMGGTAREAYDNRIAAGAMHGTGAPPPGSLPYFNWTDPRNGINEGHVGIAQADGTFRSALNDGIRDLTIGQYLNANPSASYLGWVMPYAKGTDYAPGGLALVGENGPELLNLRQGTGVIPNNRVAGAINSSINETLNIVSTVTSQLAQALNDGFASLSASLQHAAAQPVQITKTVNIHIDSQYLNSAADVSAFASQMQWMAN